MTEPKALTWPPNCPHPIQLSIRAFVNPWTRESDPTSFLFRVPLIQFFFFSLSQPTEVPSAWTRHFGIGFTSEDQKLCPFLIYGQRMERRPKGYTANILVPGTTGHAQMSPVQVPSCSCCMWAVIVHDMVSCPYRSDRKCVCLCQTATVKRSDQCIVSKRCLQKSSAGS